GTAWPAVRLTMPVTVTTPDCFGISATTLLFTSTRAVPEEFRLSRYIPVEGGISEPSHFADHGMRGPRPPPRPPRPPAAAPAGGAGFSAATGGALKSILASACFATGSP